MSSLQDRIVQRLTNSFIVSGTVDPEALARDMQKEFPGVELAELSTVVMTVAAGIGVRTKGSPDELDEPTVACGACA
jgi:hypothetical protein